MLSKWSFGHPLKGQPGRVPLDPVQVRLALMQLFGKWLVFFPNMALEPGFKVAQEAEDIPLAT
jgi:hypothetical protein